MNPRPIPDKNIESVEKAARRSLGDRVLLTLKRRAAGGLRVEYTVLCASTKIVYPLGGREFSVHTAVWKHGDEYLFIEGEYGLTFDAAVKAYNAREGEK